MKPHIKCLPKTGDATRYLVDNKLIVISGHLAMRTNKHPLMILRELLSTSNTLPTTVIETAYSSHLTPRVKLTPHIKTGVE